MFYAVVPGGGNLKAARDNVLAQAVTVPVKLGNWVSAWAWHPWHQPNVKFKLTAIPSLVPGASERFAGGQCPRQQPQDTSTQVEVLWRNAALGLGHLPGSLLSSSFQIPVLRGAF